jgi:hypothetical protein
MTCVRRARRFEVPIHRAPVNGKPTRDLLARAVTRGQALAQAALQLIDKIIPGNRLQIANGSLESKLELRVRRAQSEAEMLGWKDDRRQFLID